MKKILVADDNKDVRFSVVQGLKAIGVDYSFFEAENGKEALKILKKEEIDLVLLDIMMPKMDGWQVVTEMKKNQKLKEIPVIYLTAKSDGLSKKLGSIAAKDYIEKPFDILDLKKRIKKII